MARWSTSCLQIIRFDGTRPTEPVISVSESRRAGARGGLRELCIADRRRVRPVVVTAEVFRPESGLEGVVVSSGGDTVTINDAPGEAELVPARPGSASPRRTSPAAGRRPGSPGRGRRRCGRWADSSTTDGPRRMGPSSSRTTPASTSARVSAPPRAPRAASAHAHERGLRRVRRVEPVRRRARYAPVRAVAFSTATPFGTTSGRGCLHVAGRGLVADGDAPTTEILARGRGDGLRHRRDRRRGRGGRGSGLRSLAISSPAVPARVDDAGKRVRAESADVGWDTLRVEPGQQPPCSGRWPRIGWQRADERRGVPTDRGDGCCRQRTAPSVAIVTPSDGAILTDTTTGRGRRRGRRVRPPERHHPGPAGMRFVERPRELLRGAVHGLVGRGSMTEWPVRAPGGRNRPPRQQIGLGFGGRASQTAGRRGRRR